MKILVADDDPISRCLLRKTLEGWGYEVVGAVTGLEALHLLMGEDAPSLAILDWIMPEVEGVDLCRRVRAGPERRQPYLILLTGKGGKENVLKGLESGADDFITKPFDLDELRMRLHVGQRIVNLQLHLSRQVDQLEQALGEVHRLRGLLPICAWCKKVRNDQDYWQSVEEYLTTHFDTRLTHSVCPSCAANMVNTELAAVLRAGGS